MLAKNNRYNSDSYNQYIENMFNHIESCYSSEKRELFIEKMNRLNRQLEMFGVIEIDDEDLINSIINNGKITTIAKDLEHKSTLYKSQRRYDDLLSNCPYNREIKDYQNGNYKQAGKNISYLYNEHTGQNRFLFGYNFNHTLSCMYMNRENKKNLAKVSRIMKDYYDQCGSVNHLYFCTLTMPNLDCDCEKIDEHNEMLKNANNVINNLNKKIAKNYKVNGFIKKFECTFKVRSGANEVHPHYHLLIAFKKDDGIRIMRDSKNQKSLSNEIFDYWYENFIKKYFKAEDTVKSFHEEIEMLNISYIEKLEKQFKRNCRAGYDFRKCDDKKLELELVGYVAKTTKNHNNQFDYLKNQEIFNYAYLLFFRKRILTYVGKFKEINKAIKEEEIDIDEIHEEEKELYTHKVMCRYDKGRKGYAISGVKEIDCDEDFYDDFLNRIYAKRNEKNNKT